MEPPTYQGFEAVHSEKFNVFKAMRPLTTDDLVRGQFAGYRDEPGVASDSDIETFCALRLFIDSWRWAGVPWYVRSGQVPGGNGRRSGGRAAPTATGTVRRLHRCRQPSQLPAVPALTQPRHRARRTRQARR